MTTAEPRPPLAPGETRTYPVLPLRDIVVFPHMIAPLFVGRKKSILALEEVMRSDTFILLATQKNASDDDPATEAIYEVGTLASVLQLLKLPDGTVKVVVEGAQRAQVVKYTDCGEYYEAEAVALGDTMGERVEAKAFARSVTTDDAQAGADRVGRDHGHRSGRAGGGPRRGGSLDAHRALNDCDTVPRRLSLLKTSSTRASLVIPAAHWAETTTFLPCVRF